jgi:hypothetical protein
MNDNTQKKSYYAVIPASVRYDNNLTANAKLLYGEITALCNERGYCWASNRYFAQLYNTEQRTIRRWIENLKERGYVEVEVKRNNSNEVEERKIYLVEALQTKMSLPPDKNVLTPPDKNVLYNTTESNNTENKLLPKGSSKKPDGFQKLEKWMSVIEELKKSFSFRIPKKEWNPTKTLLKVLKYLEMLEKGRFSKEVQYKEKIKFPKMSVEVVYDKIVEALKLLELRRSAGYYPVNKTYVDAVNVSSFFLNEKTGHSWFCDLLENGAKEVDQSFTIPEEVEERYRILCSNKGLDYFESVQSAVHNIVSFGDSFGRKYEKYFYGLPGFERLNDGVKVAMAFADFLSKWHDLHIGNLLVGKKSWILFEQEVFDFYNIMLRPSKTFLSQFEEIEEEEKEVNVYKAFEEWLMTEIPGEYGMEDFNSWFKKSFEKEHSGYNLDRILSVYRKNKAKVIVKGMEE